MDRFNYQGAASLQSDVEANWRGSTVGDFNSNGKPDIVKTNYATGENAFWLMNGLTYQGAGSLPTYSNFYTNPAASTNNLTFTGREDDGTGLVYYRARYYSPRLQRFISPDPLGFDAGDINLYRYVNNQPNMETDPTGLDPFNVIIFRDPSPSPGPSSGPRPCNASFYIDFEEGSYIIPDRLTGGDGVDLLVIAQGPGGLGSNYGNSQSTQNMRDFLREKNSQLYQSTKINVDQQRKHLPGNKQFIPGRSELTYKNPQELIDKFAGTGQPVGNVPRGEPGFKECINFREIIGNYINNNTGRSFPTTNGIIHYGLKGVHIVPSAP